MAEAGLTAQEALEIYLATLRQVTQQIIPDEQAIGRTVYRLEQGIWDAGEQARETIRRAREAIQPKKSASEGNQGDDQEQEDDLDHWERLERLSETHSDPLDHFWQKALGELQLELTRATFETLLRGSRLVACEDGVFVIGVTNTYARDWLDSRLRPVITRVLNRLTGREVAVRFVVLTGG